MCDTVLEFDDDDFRGFHDFPDFFGFEIIELIGTAGLCRMYRARQRSLNRDVAIRCIHSRLAESNRYPLLRTEAAILSRLTHPNIVTLLDCIDQRDNVFLVLEYAAGGSLATVFKEQQLSPWLAASLVERIARTLAYIHDQSITHCDLKPQNILLAAPHSHSDPKATGLDYETALGRPLISSFTLAVDEQIRADLPEGTIRGTAAYMAPEQVRGSWKEIGPASDIYAVGGILYTLLAGHHPFAGQAQNPSSLFDLKLNENPQSVSQLNAATDADLEEICHRCLHRQPESRYPDALSLARDLQEYLRHRRPEE